LRLLKIADMEEKELADEQKLKDDKQSAFFTKVSESDDHEDILEDLSNYLQEYTSSTSVYVAKLVEEKNPIDLDDDDTAHIIEDAKCHLDIYHASPKGFEFLLRKQIKSSEGVVHEIFIDKEEPHVEPQEVQVEGEGETEPAPVEEVKPQYVSVDEIVRESKLKFFKVPRLGSLLCVRLKYDSCLSELSLDEAVQDVYDVESRQKQQDTEKQLWEDQENKRKEEAEKANEEFEPEEKEWEEIAAKPFHCEVVDYAVCLDTMGQDRQFTEDETSIALDAVATFAKNWQDQEIRNLSKDIQRKITKTEEDRVFTERAKAKFEENIEKYVDQNTEETEEPKGKLNNNSNYPN
jgi:hypothetical protein